MQETSNWFPALRIFEYYKTCINTTVCVRRGSPKFLIFLKKPDFNEEVVFHETKMRNSGSIKLLQKEAGVNASLCYFAIPFRSNYFFFSKFFNLRLFVTTKMLLNDIAPAANMGCKNPAAATGIRMIL